MNFNLANNGPVAVTIDGTQYLVPRFKRKHWVAWGAEIDGARTDAATKGMKPDERYRYLSVYPILPVTTDELSRQMFTLAGTERVLRTCLGAGGVPPDVVERVLEEAPPKTLQTLAITLASIVDPDQIRDADDTEKGQQGEKPDPLPSAAGA